MQASLKVCKQQSWVTGQKNLLTACAGDPHQAADHTAYVSPLLQSSQIHVGDSLYFGHKLRQQLSSSIFT